MIAHNNQYRYQWWEFAIVFHCEAFTLKDFIINSLFQNYGIGHWSILWTRPRRSPDSACDRKGCWGRSGHRKRFLTALKTGLFRQIRKIVWPQWSRLLVGAVSAALHFCYHRRGESIEQQFTAIFSDFCDFVCPKHDDIRLRTLCYDLRWVLRYKKCFCLCFRCNSGLGCRGDYGPSNFSVNSCSELLVLV